MIDALVKKLERLEGEPGDGERLAALLVRAGRTVWVLPERVQAQVIQHLFEHEAKELDQKITRLKKYRCRLIGRMARYNFDGYVSRYRVLRHRGVKEQESYIETMRLLRVQADRLDLWLQRVLPPDAAEAARNERLGNHEPLCSPGLDRGKA